MDIYIVVGIIAIPCVGFGVTINVVSKDDILYCITIGITPSACAWTLPNCDLML